MGSNMLPTGSNNCHALIKANCFILHRVSPWRSQHDPAFAAIGCSLSVEFGLDDSVGRYPEHGSVGVQKHGEGNAKVHVAVKEQTRDEVGSDMEDEVVIEACKDEAKYCEHWKCKEKRV